MCLTTKLSTNNPTIKSFTRIAKRRILVYKRLKTWGNTPHQGFSWPDGDAIISVRSLGVTKHSTPGATRLMVNRGLHAHIIRADAKGSLGPNEEIHRMIIPKGATYVVGIYNDIVSTQLRRFTKKDKGISPLKKGEM